jgi:hypothetical protein
MASSSEERVRSCVAIITIDVVEIIRSRSVIALLALKSKWLVARPAIKPGDDATGRSYGCCLFIEVVGANRGSSSYEVLEDRSVKPCWILG